MSLGLAGCGSPPVTSPNANTANVNAAPTNTNNPLETTTPTPQQTTNDAPTLTPAFKAYCDAKIKGDEAALRRVYSAGTIKNMEEQMKAESIKSLVKWLEDDKVTARLCEVRNEQINGDRAVAEIRFETYPNGFKVVFVKENGEWKLTNEAADFVKPAANNVNNAR